MSNGIVTRFSGTLVLLLLSLLNGYSQVTDHQSIRVMFYNVENLFDTFDDPLTDDNEFLPEGTRRWTQTRYKKKINSISKVIIAAGEWSSPAIVALCEIENRRVLNDLVNGTLLSKFNYGIIHEDSKDARGIDVCMIYRRDAVNIVDYRYFGLPAEGPSSFPTRSVLHTRINLLGDTVNLFVNHWPSRRGGVMAAEEQRIKLAKVVREKTDSLLMATDRNGKIVIMGDFNATPEDDVIKILTSSRDSGNQIVNLSQSLPDGSGTYRYMGRWEMIDQIFVSRGLIDSSRGLNTGSNMLKICDYDFMLKDDSRYPGKSPFSTWSGFRYQGGFSDHLPVLLDLNIR